MRRGGIALAVGLVVSTISLTPLNEAAAAPTAVYLPNVTKTLGGATGWTTPVAVQNTGSVSTVVTLELYRFSDGAQIATVTSPSLRPGQAWLFDPLGYGSVPEDTQFSLVDARTRSTSVSSPPALPRVATRCSWRVRRARTSSRS